MNKFPVTINSKYREKFSQHNRNRLKKLLRVEITENILNRKDETDYYSLSSFESKYSVSMSLVQELVMELIGELNKLGWKCELSYGDTGLFIYHDKRPMNCF